MALKGKTTPGNVPQNSPGRKLHGSRLGIATTHASKRVRKRAGLSKRAVARMTTRALREGLRPGSFTGEFRHYLDDLSDASSVHPVVMFGYVFVFNLDDAVLITMWRVPKKYQKYL